MPNLFTFPCGCSFEIVGDPVLPKSKLPAMILDVQNIRHDCPKTWEILARGFTAGVFQLESNLGTSWVKKLKPESIDHMAALGALLRPGCLKALDSEGISMTEHYSRRKNGLEEVEIFHECLRHILSSTYGILTFQEQALQIARDIAGFNLQEADELRKSIGKKLPELMAKVKTMFVDGAERKQIVDTEAAAEIFGWIEKSQRYSFNRSHAVCYGLIGYITAFAKAHFPIEFFTSYLFYAKEKADHHEEVQKLIAEAKLFDIEVRTPDLRSFAHHFITDGESIYFGLADIKGVGENACVKLQSFINDQEIAMGEPFTEWSWYEFLLLVARYQNVAIMRAIVVAGAIDFYGVPRTRMMFEIDRLSQLTSKESDWIDANWQAYDGLQPLLADASKVKKNGGAAANVNRSAIVADLAKSISEPPYPLTDSPDWVAGNEENLLGVPITYTKLDSRDTTSARLTCREYLDGARSNLVFAVQIIEYRECKVKNGKSAGQQMAFMEIKDDCTIKNVTAFPKILQANKHLLFEGNTILLEADHDKKRDSLIVKKVWQI